MERPLPRRVRRFWRGDAALGDARDALAGSSDIFGNGGSTRSVNFVAAHDGLTLADVVAYTASTTRQRRGQPRRPRREPSWNHGVEGATTTPAVLAARARDLRALLATLFAVARHDHADRGRRVRPHPAGNNNAYAQDNAI
jgi:glycogen debranching enzyme